MRKTGHCRRGFTLLELMMVVAIIGILSAIAVPNLLVAIQRAKQRRAMVDMKNIAQAWEARNSEVSRYNAAGASYDGAGVATELSLIFGILSPTYMQTVPTVDPWSNGYCTFLERSLGDAMPAQKYAIVSGGKDGILDTTSLPGPITNFDCDIVYSNGTFLSYPDGLTIK